MSRTRQPDTARVRQARAIEDVARVAQRTHREDMPEVTGWYLPPEPPCSGFIPVMADGSGRRQ